MESNKEDEKKISKDLKSKNFAKLTVNQKLFGVLAAPILFLLTLKMLHATSFIIGTNQLLS